MAPSQRRLPERKNALLTESLSARLVAVSPSSNAERNSVTAFDYAHLRAPLPKGIVSGIFKPSPNSYFLMRRSSDGYVSATGMFRATFPYAELEEEEEERRYIKSLPTTSPEETAGNIWVPPVDALALAGDYDILPWIRALLDPADIPVSGPPAADGSPSKKIVPPPKFALAPTPPTLVPPTPTSLPRSARSRRSVSPTKSATGTSKRAIASPRKRSTKAAAAAAAAAASQETSVASTESTPAPQSAGLTNGDGKDVLPSVEEEEVVKDAKDAKESKKEKKERKHAKKKSDASVAADKVFTAGSDGDVLLAGQPLSAEDSARLLAEAKAMVAEAANDVAEAAASAASAAGASSKKGKRKAEEQITKDGEAGKENAGEGAATQQPRAKKIKTDVQIRKERVRNRALLGISATLAVGAFIPYVMGML
ncbi:apses transcription factor [Sporothrix brasiliensis 5110]|uniref:Apses transcription factor n=1 Tax=Sporothrix brasiliensis 5110 TaxID=1398154 RepID=A0A0C2II01_9PEZI|nr:apses transcription factor [Sporothrix brasiliensis 5110]KIH88816.1 apses transcription factor [Sporothrix brasiliensis 5110]